MKKHYLGTVHAYRDSGPNDPRFFVFHQGCSHEELLKAYTDNGQKAPTSFTSKILEIDDETWLQLYPSWD